MSAGIVYYSDNHCDPVILAACRKQLLHATSGLTLISVTLTPLDLGQNLVLPLQRGILTMFRQILAGLERLSTDLAFFAEHDVLYHPSHFLFEPPDRAQVWYNTATWKVDATTGRALHYRCQQTSGLCADRALLVDHYRTRVAVVAACGYSRRIGFEPGTHRRAERIDDLTAQSWHTFTPNLDLRHADNLTPSRWRPEQFRTPPTDWRESHAVPGWGVTLGRMPAFLATLAKE